MSADKNVTRDPADAAPAGNRPLEIAQ